MVVTGAALRLRLLFRMLRVGELLALAALISWYSSRAPSAAAAAVRVAGSLLFSPRFVFVLGNAIVLLLLALSRRERDPSPAFSSNHPATGTSSAAVAVEMEHIPAAPAAASFPSYAAQTMPTPESEAATAATSAPEVLPCREMVTVFEEEVKPAAVVAVARVVVASKARAPRRSRSEKMSPRGLGSRRAASPEAQMPVMRRSESENGRRRGTWRGGPQGRRTRRSSSGRWRRSSRSRRGSGARRSAWPALWSSWNKLIRWWETLLYYYVQSTYGTSSG
ncbi:hypothetical protein ACQ4PT_043288 [Festuca glaucescens]